MHSTCVYVSAFATAISMEMSLPMVGYIFCKNCILAWGGSTESACRASFPNRYAREIKLDGTPGKAVRSERQRQNWNGRLVLSTGD
jgi:hypothetical protein